MELGEVPQEREVVLAPGDDVVEIVAGGNCGTYYQQQDLPERIEDPQGLPPVVELRDMRQQQVSRARGASSSMIVSATASMGSAPCRISTPRESRPRVNTKSASKAALTPRAVPPRGNQVVGAGWHS